MSKHRLQLRHGLVMDNFGVESPRLRIRRAMSCHGREDRLHGFIQLEPNISGFPMYQTRDLAEIQFRN